MGMDIKRWAKRDDLKDSLREMLNTPTLIGAIELIEHDGKPSTNIKGLSQDYMNNVALTHAYQAGIHYALQRLRDLPNAVLNEGGGAEFSWERFGKIDE